MPAVLYLKRSRYSSVMLPGQASATVAVGAEMFTRLREVASWKPSQKLEESSSSNSTPAAQPVGRREPKWVRSPSSNIATDACTSPATRGPREGRCWHCQVPLLPLAFTVVVSQGFTCGLDPVLVAEQDAPARLSHVQQQDAVFGGDHVGVELLTALYWVLDGLSLQAQVVVRQQVDLQNRQPGLGRILDRIAEIVADLHVSQGAAMLEDAQRRTVVCSHR